MPEIKWDEFHFCRASLFHFSFLCPLSFSIPFSYVCLLFIWCFFFFLACRFLGSSWSPFSSFFSHEKVLYFLHTDIVLISLSEPNSTVTREEYLWHLANVLLQYRQVVSSFKMQQTLLSEQSKFLNNHILPPVQKYSSKKMSISLIASGFYSSTSQEHFIRVCRENCGWRWSPFSSIILNVNIQQGLQRWSTECWC